jgi:mono/diheme cytochrome c family protein
MMARRTTGLLVCVLTGAMLVTVVTESVTAAPTAAQRRELTAARRTITRASALIRRKKLAEAEKLLGEAEASIKKVIKAAKLKPTDRSVAGLVKFLELQKRQLAIRKGNKPTGKSAKSAKPVSFVKDVVPILVARCGTCHGTRASGRLKLDTFAGLARGGRSGPAVRAGKSNASLLVQRIAATNANQRMPKSGAALTRAQITTIATWVAQGAKFDGTGTNTPLRSLKSAAGGTPKGTPKPVTVKIVKATGKEKVSFVKDVAPTLTTLCAGCHGRRNGRGGFSLLTFESMMKGSDSGRVVLPGNLEGSIIWRRVAALDKDKQKMPPGNRRITREFFNSLRTWIQEGAKFDGESATVPLQSLVPTDEDKKAEMLAKLSPEEFNDLREKRIDEFWARVSKDDRPRFVKTADFFVYGDVPATRLQQVAEWADDHGKQLRTMFGEKSGQLFKGRLAVVVFKERFGYTEWNQVIHNRQTPRAMSGHSVVTPSFEDAYIVLQDVGDVVTPGSAGMKIQLIDHLTGAFLKRSGSRLPQWLVRGVGLTLAAKSDSKNVHIAGLRDGAVAALQGLTKPEDLFADGTFSPQQVGAVGYTLVRFMIKAGGGGRFVRFVRNLQNGTAVAASVKAIYAPTDLKRLAAAYVQSLAGKKR